jgi:hypothetical protein
MCKERNPKNLKPTGKSSLKNSNNEFDGDIFFKR